MASNSLDKSEDYAKKAIKLSSNPSYSLSTLAICYIAQGKDIKAQNIYDLFGREEKVEYPVSIHPELSVDVEGNGILLIRKFGEDLDFFRERGLINEEQYNKAQNWLYHE